MANLFSKNLRWLRKKGSHNQEEISHLFQKRANTIGNWENQKSEPSIAELMKLGEFFDISIQALLHSDLEKESLSNHPAASTPITHSKMKDYPLPESIQSIAREPGSDAFWLILRELKVMNERLDSLTAGIPFSSNRPDSDKSSH
jgi:transcriptional regulator with XRE-family HTH domain